MVRHTLLQNHLSFGLAVQFQKAMGITAGGVLVSGGDPIHVRVLAVEPDVRMANMIRDLLEADGYQVTKRGARSVEYRYAGCAPGGR